MGVPELQSGAGRKSPHAERTHAKAGRRALGVERGSNRLALELTEALAGCTEDSSEERELIDWATIKSSRGSLPK